MANHRSMLPKFRPATLNALAGSERPKIRPVKPSAPPPPPRRHSSGIRNQDEPEQGAQNYGEPPTMAAARARIHEIARELPAENRFPEPGYARQNFNDETQGRIDDADLGDAHAAYDRQFGAPPQAHEDAYDRLPALGHHDHFEAPYDAPYAHQDPATELRPAYDEVLQRHEEKFREEPQPFRSDRPLPEDDPSGEYARRERRSPPPPATYSAASNSYDPAAYEANYPKSARRDEPSYADRRDHVGSAPRSDRHERHEERRDEGRSFRRDDFPRESSYRDERRHDEGRSFRREEPRREASYQPPRADETRAEGSSAKHDKRGEGSWNRGNEPSIPAPANVPRDLRVPENFVVGVQPLRTPSMGAPQAVIAPAYPAMTAAASPGAMNMGMPMSSMSSSASSLGQMGMPVIPQISMPPMMAPMSPMGHMGHMGGMPGPMMNPMGHRAHTSGRPGHLPQPTEIEEAQQGSKVGRFAWFVFGAAFGIFFAFAATGFGFGKKDDPVGSFPPPPATLTPPVQTAPPAPPPPPMQPQPVAQAPAPVMQPGQPQPAQPIPAQPQVAALPQAPPPPLGVTVAPGQQVGPIVPAPGGPQQPQAQPPQTRPAQNQGSVVVRGGGRAASPPPRRGGGGARPVAQNNDSDDAPAPTKKSSAAEPNIADLLGDGLGK